MICDKNCWHYKDCKKKNNINIVACFKKNESICHYCKLENNCKNSIKLMIICSNFIKREVYVNESN